MPEQPEIQSELDRAFRNSGFRPPGRSATDLLRDAKDLASALGILSAAWQRMRDRTKSARLRHDAERCIDLLSRCERQLAEAWKEDDSRVPPLVKNWLGPRAWWWLGALPTGRRVAIVSSRLPRLLDPHGAWMHGLRHALTRVHEQNNSLVIGHGTAGHELIMRGAVRQGFPIIMLRCCDATAGANWSAHWASHLNEVPPEGVIEGWALPLLNSSLEQGDEPSISLWKLPERDRAAITWADEVIVLGLRRRGNLDALLRHRLNVQPSSVLLADLPGLQPPKLRDELVTLGAALWSPVDSKWGGHSCLPRRTGMCAPQTGNQTHESGLLPLSPTDGWDYLTHATRACTGPWPGQSKDDYLDSLLDARPDSDRSPLTALLHIIAQRRLHASNRTIRGGFDVVSFTAVPLAELPRLRVFRSHRGRWDFEPYGICIRKAWLEKHGARPVQYYQESAWQSLAAADRPFFQKARSVPRRKEDTPEHASGVDWSVEREWRHRGELDLSELSPTDALVFVPTPEAAQAVLAVSPWPVTVLPSATQEADSGSNQSSP